MTKNERDLLRCAALLRRYVTEAMEKLGTERRISRATKVIEGKDALDLLAAVEVSATYPLEPLDDEPLPAAAHRVFGSFIYNQVFDRPPWSKE